MQDYLAQILSGLNAIHAGGLVHRGTFSSPLT
jgi:serine/threonine protein kinase